MSLTLTRCLSTKIWNIYNIYCHKAAWDVKSFVRHYPFAGKWYNWNIMKQWTWEALERGKLCLCKWSWSNDLISGENLQATKNIPDHLDQVINMYIASTGIFLEILVTHLHGPNITKHRNGSGVNGRTIS